MRITLLAAVGVLVAGALFFYTPIRDFVSGVSPIARPAPPLPPPGEQLPFSLPSGFAGEIFADELPGARVMIRDVLGNFWVSETSEGIVSLLEIDEGSGEVANVIPVFQNLRRPHGLAIDPIYPFTLYIAEEHRVSKVNMYSEGAPQTIVELPAGGGHYTRSLMAHPDGKRLLISVGSSCNVCEEDDPRRAAILSYDFESGEILTFATGLRNTVFMTTHYVTGDIWGTDMGRDNIGDDIPPDEINIVREGGKYGWPYCYGKNTPDTNFASDATERCTMSVPSHLDLQAHSAPLGIAFVPEEGWPEEYWYDAILAYHGSWNRSVPTGYKLVRFPLDANGNPEGPPVDFMTGFMTGDGAIIGRPVDILIEPGGVMYVSDDRAGAIYRIVRTSLD